MDLLVSISTKEQSFLFHSNSIHLKKNNVISIHSYWQHDQPNRSGSKFFLSILELPDVWGVSGIMLMKLLQLLNTIFVGCLHFIRKYQKCKASYVSSTFEFLQNNTKFCSCVIYFGIKGASSIRCTINVIHCFMYLTFHEGPMYFPLTCGVYTTSFFFLWMLSSNAGGNRMGAIMLPCLTLWEAHRGGHI